MAEERKITILVAEDSQVTLAALKHLLAQCHGFRMVGHAPDGPSAVRMARELNPDVVIMDIGLPQMSGIEATRRIKSELPETKVVMLTVHESDASVFDALRAGAHGYCLKTVNAQQLSTAIKTVYDGAAWLDPKIARRVLEAATNPAAAADEGRDVPKVSLSSRELEVLRLVVEGLTNQEIASKLILSVETVKSHVRHIMDKMAVSDRTQAAVKAVRDRLV
ncbi:MAG TPA: response regulator transcription factor [Candidatus Obscuribacterales bacterium]